MQKMLEVEFTFGVLLISFNICV